MKYAIMSLMIASSYVVADQEKTPEASVATQQVQPQQEIKPEIKTIPAADVSPVKSESESLPKPPVPITADEVEKKEAQAIFGLDAQTPEKIVAFIQPYLLAGGVAEIRESLRNVSADKMAAVIKILFGGPAGTLSADDQIRLFILLAALFKDREIDFFKILDAGAQMKLFKQDMQSPLVAVVLEKQEKLVPLIVRWIQKKMQEQLDDTVRQQLSMVFYDAAYDAAILADSDVQVSQTLHAQGLPLTQEEAARLLWDIVATDKGAAAVKNIIEVYRPNVNYIDPKSHYSLLMRATENGNYVMVKALLEGKADPNLMSPNAALGTALQIAIRDRMATIDTLLRQFGAREDAGLLQELAPQETPQKKNSKKRKVSRAAKQDEKETKVEEPLKMEF